MQFTVIKCIVFGSEWSLSENHLEKAQSSASMTAGPKCPIGFPTASELGSEIPLQCDYRTSTILLV